MYDRVLVPTDGSETVSVAVDHAIGIATRNDAELHTVYVLETGQFSELLDEEEFRGTLDRLQEAGENAVEAVVDSATAEGVTARSAVLEGRPTTKLLEYVEDQRIDLIVMASQGRTGEAREFIGSVTEEVVCASPVPVLTINT